MQNASENIVFEMAPFCPGGDELNTNKSYLNSSSDSTDCSVISEATPKSIVIDITWIHQNST